MGGLLNDPIPSLHGPPFWEVVLLHSPFLGASAVMLLALLLASALNRTGKGKHALTAAGVGSVLAVGVAVLAGLVETTSEKTLAAQQAFIESIIAGDEASLEELIGDRLVVVSAGERIDGLGKDEIVAAASLVAQAYESHDVNNKGLEVMGPGQVRSRFFIRVTVNAGPLSAGMATSIWEMTFARNSAPRAENAMQIIRLECLAINGKEPSSWWHRVIR